MACLLLTHAHLPAALPGVSGSNLFTVAWTNKATVWDTAATNSPGASQVGSLESASCCSWEGVLLRSWQHSVL